MNLTEISKPIFLHFLSRGLQESVHSYMETQYSKIEDDFKIMLTSSYEPAYISTAHLFENEYAFRLLNSFPSLFWHGHILISQNETSIEELVIEKRYQYSHVKSKYKTYYNDRWKIIVDKGPSIKYTGGVSKFLHKDLLEAFASDNIKNTFAEDNDLLLLSPFIVESIHERKNKALTNDLFKPLYSRFDVQKFKINKLDRIINEYYLKVQMNRDNGTIMTGVSSGVEYYSFLCPTYPFLHIPLWKNIYQILGLRQLIRELSDTEFNLLRESAIFMQFIDIIRILISKSLTQDTDPLTFVKYIKYTSQNSGSTYEKLDRFFEILNKFISDAKKELISDFASDINLMVLDNLKNYKIDNEQKRFEQNTLNLPSFEQALTNSMMLKEKWTSDIVNGKIGVVIRELVNYTNNIKDEEEYNLMIHTASMYNRLQKELNLGIITSDYYNLEISKVIRSLMSILNSIK